MEFTGDYFKCESCGHIYDYNDVCPVCGKDCITELNAKEVNEIVDRIIDMLERHLDRF